MTRQRQKWEVVLQNAAFGIGLFPEPIRSCSMWEGCEDLRVFLLLCKSLYFLVAVRVKSVCFFFFSIMIYSAFPDALLLQCGKASAWGHKARLHMNNVEQTVSSS